MTLLPRAVVVTRPTDHDRLIERHGTREQARFFLERRGQSLSEIVTRHEEQVHALEHVTASIPSHWRRTRVARADLDRFLFEPEDIVIAVGQDGLVANVAKYLDGQPVVGVNPSTRLYDGILVRHEPEVVKDVLVATAGGRARIEERSMVSARTSDGQTLLALNEIYVGHRSHQSARYRIAFAGREERHSSSGLIVASGTGATGWARSIALGRRDTPSVPAPTDPELAFFVREAWPSVRTGTSLVGGIVAAGAVLTIDSEMDEGGVAFGDGIEADRLELPYGQVVSLARADRTLRLVA